MTGKRRSPERAAPHGDVRADKHPDDALELVEASIQAAWAQHREAQGELSDEAVARQITNEPQQHPWRLVDAALDRLRCPECGDHLGRGPRGCASCDLADGFRFAAQEPDRPGVPAGNEHAIRVSTAVLRAPRRHPAWAVEANRVHLPLFLAGQMPTRPQQEAMLAAWRAGVAVRADGAATFEELAARALEALAKRG